MIAPGPGQLGHLSFRGTEAYLVTDRHACGTKGSDMSVISHLFKEYFGQESHEFHKVKIVSHITNKSLIYSRCVQIISRILIIVKRDFIREKERERNVMHRSLDGLLRCCFWCCYYRRRHGRGAQGGISSTPTKILSIRARSSEVGRKTPKTTVQERGRRW